MKNILNGKTPQNINQSILNKIKKGQVMKTNMYSKSVKQWNPFVGCKFDCKYCFSSFRRQAKRQKHNCMSCYNFEPHTHPERLNNSLPRTEQDEFIFTCSNGDISFCSTDYLKQIVERIEGQSHKRFLLQSKNPKTFERIKFPENVLLGITLETNRDEYVVSKAPKYSQRYKDFKQIPHPHKMITIEPILDFDLDEFVRWIEDINPELVWMGYDSGKNNLPEPSLDKFNELHKRLIQSGYKVKLKTVRE